MSLPESVTIPTLSDCQFYHENPPSISSVHRHPAQAVQVPQHTKPASPLLSPLLSPLHHPQIGGQHTYTYAMRSKSHSSIELQKCSFKQNQAACNLQGNFSPQHRLVPHSPHVVSSFRNQQQYNCNTWGRRKKDSSPAPN